VGYESCGWGPEDVDEDGEGDTETCEAVAARGNHFELWVSKGNCSSRWDCTLSV
jgi:hypothetical protein